LEIIIFHVIILHYCTSCLLLWWIRNILLKSWSNNFRQFVRSGVSLLKYTKEKSCVSATCTFDSKNKGERLDDYSSLRVHQIIFTYLLFQDPSLPHINHSNKYIYIYIYIFLIGKSTYQICESLKNEIASWSRV